MGQHDTGDRAVAHADVDAQSALASFEERAQRSTRARFRLWAPEATL